MKVFYIIITTLLAICGIAAFVITFVELRPLFAGDYLLMNSSAVGFVKYLFRGSFFLALGVNAICAIITIIKSEEPSTGHIIICIALLIGSVIAAFFVEAVVAAVAICSGVFPCSIIIRLVRDN